MRQPFPTLLLLACAMPAQAQAAGPRAAVVCHDSEDLTVRLTFATRADASDPDWLAFEFVNRGAAAITLAGFAYNLHERVVRDLGTGALVCSGSLASGSHADLFGMPGPVVLPPGSTRVTRHVRDASTALLGHPPPGGWRIDAKVAVAVARTGEQFVGPELPGVAFAFDWMRPDEAGLARLRARLDELMRQQEPSTAIYPLVAMLLDTPGVGDRVPLERLLAARPRDRNAFFAWPAVLRHLNARFADDPALLGWVQQRLAGDDPHIVEDLTGLWNVWQTSFLLELVRRHEAGDALVLWVLEQRGAPQTGDPAAARRLSRRSLASLPAKPPAAESQDLDLHRRIAEVLREIGRTYDRTCIDVVAPWLDCRLPLFHERPFGFEPGIGDCHRICDAALGALVRLGGDGAKQHVDGAVEPVQVVVQGRVQVRRTVIFSQDLDALDREQDTKIAAMKDYLAARARAK
ncbi:MAG TPA: hypothetical protein VFZ65_22280 [Planctomycetota bacterium]|nr:hypothetical protein [Planctomycetota bacterium]